MASKDSALKKRLVKEGILSVVALVVLAAGGMLVSNYDDDAQAEKRVKENESSSLQAQHTSIQQQLGSGMEVNAFYNIYIKNHSDDLMIKRETTPQSMAILREANHLANLGLTIAPISDAKTDLVQVKSGNLIKSDVHLTFGGVSDNSVYGFIESLQRKLPGIVVHRLKDRA